MTGAQTPSGGFARRTGRILGRVLALATIAAAGAAGWFGYERLALAEDEEPADALAEADVAMASPLPPELLGPVEPAGVWRSFHHELEQDGVVVREVRVDRNTSVTRMTLLDDGTPYEAEFTQLGLTTRTIAEGARWYDKERHQEYDLSIEAFGDTAPIHLAGVLPDEANAFATLESDAPAGETRQLVVVVDGAAYRAAFPNSYGNWLNTMSADAADLHRWTLDVRGDGYIVGWDGRRVGTVERWSELTERVERNTYTMDELPLTEPPPAD